MKFKIEYLSSSPPNCHHWSIEDYATIGSDSSCNIFINATDLAPRHARLELRDSKLFVKDLRSSIGTTINGARVLEAFLQDGDQLALGRHEFIIHDLSRKKPVFPLKSRNEDWQKKLQTMASVAQTIHPVLLLGPSGTGKDVLAQTIHQCSKRSAFSFLSVNCSALTETLIESELFGHIKGSFTGAVNDRKGAFETARNGTLFLDEIGDLPYSLQAKLLRALENNEIHPVGSDRNIKTNVRIIAATHQNLRDKILDGTFRADLFYRLNVITLDVPALQSRMEDFDDIFYQFAREMRVRFSHAAIAQLKKHNWPGNIRELKNVVARASALFPKESIEESHLDLILNKLDRTEPNQSATPTGATASRSVIREIERQMILRRLEANQGNQKRTASDLGMPKSTLHDRIRHYGIEPENFKPDFRV